MTTREQLLERFRDEAAGPPNGTEVALRCTAHGRFIVWVSPPAPPSRIACTAECRAQAILDEPAPVRSSEAAVYAGRQAAAREILGP